MKLFTVPTLALLLAVAPTASPHAQDAAAGPAAPSTPVAADLLFERAQMSNVAVGSTIVYEYLRRSGIAKGPFGPDLSDTITFGVEAGNAAESRDVRVTLFTGINRIPAGPFKDMPGNPIVSLFLENHLKNLARVLEANPRYLQNAIRKGLREKAVVTATTATVGGRSVEAWRVTTKPFEGDALTPRMRGLDNMTYTFVTSPAVPGEIVSIEAQSKNAAGGELLEERVSYEQKAG